jgi:hypothetical protein
VKRIDGFRRQPEVARRDEDVVDVEQQPAPGAPRERLEEVDLVPFVADAGEVVGRVFDRDPAAERSLHPVDVLDDARQCLARARKRQQIGAIRALPGRPRQMLGHERGRESIDEGGEAAQVSSSGGASAASESATPCSDSGCRARIASSHARRGPPATM